MIRVVILVAAALSCSSCSNSDASNDNKENVWPETFDLGREATPEEIALKDIDVGPDGAGLLHEGKGKASSGAVIYQQKCALCHGKDGKDGPFGALVTDWSDSTSSKKTVGNYWPYATTLYDYINRAMPFDKPGSLTAEEVYHITAYILYANKIIDSTTVLDYKTLPQVVMPNREMFVPDDRTGGPIIR